MAKCAFCGKELKKESAFCGGTEKKRAFFCNEEEYKQYDEECRAYEKIQEILSAIIGRPVSYAVIQKQIGDLLKEFTKREIRKCLEDNREWLSSKVSSMDLDSDYMKLKFATGCIRNELKRKTPVEYESHIEIESYETKYVPRQRKKCLQSYIDEY